MLFTSGFGGPQCTSLFTHSYNLGGGNPHWPTDLPAVECLQDSKTSKEDSLMVELYRCYVQIEVSIETYLTEQ